MKDNTVCVFDMWAFIRESYIGDHTGFSGH